MICCNKRNLIVDMCHRLLPRCRWVKGIINPVARSKSIRTDLAAAIEESAASAGFRLDNAQVLVRDRLLGLSEDLLASRWRRAQLRGLYVWGDAGCGKSWLLDAYFRALPIQSKRRVHFHGFFDQLHRRIHEHQGETSAVESAVRELTDGVKLLYFDEFHVHDSGDAALLTRLLRQLFATNVVLLASSNYAPASLLPNPIWHHLFEPGIELIQTNMDIIKLQGTEDYRARPQSSVTGFRSGRWISPDPSVQQDRHTPQDPQASDAVELIVGSRRFPVVAHRGTELWITFEQLCGAQTSSVEYLRWAQQFNHWVLLDLPSFADTDPEAQQRLINVIDVLCDADVRTTIRSPLTLEEFRATTQNRPDAFRMMSRLQLLQTQHQSQPWPPEQAV